VKKIKNEYVVCLPTALAMENAKWGSENNHQAEILADAVMNLLPPHRMWRRHQHKRKYPKCLD